MSIGLSIKVLGKGLEWYWGGGSGKWTLVQVSAVVLTIGIEFSIKV